ncbi:MAG: Fibronectin type domain protein [Myxococcales bacterium]|nr:Fibronectin type domain protein [Myxococcales bacterium]
MKRIILGLALLTACGDNTLGPPIVYTDPSGGALRLVGDPATTSHEIVLDLVVGDQTLTGFSVGFDLPLDVTKVKLAGFTPGAALDPGPAPLAAQAAMPTTGPLASLLVTGQSEKASRPGAADTLLAPGTVLYTITLDLIDGASPGLVFDGTVTGFRLPSGGLRNRAGLTIVEPKNVAIGKLEVMR